MGISFWNSMAAVEGTSPASYRLLLFHQYEVQLNELTHFWLMAVNHWFRPSLGYTTQGAFIYPTAEPPSF